MGKGEYFTKQAARYNKRLDRGVLGVIRRAERKVVLELLDPKSGEEILDIPCGAGYYANFIKENNAMVYGMDISKEMIRCFKKQGYQGEVGDLESFSLNKKFDKVLSAGGFEFCKDHKNILKNLAIHVKEKGYIIILLPRKNFFGFLYKYYHKVCNNTNIIIFSKSDIINLCDKEKNNIINMKKCSLFSYIIKVEVKRYKKNGDP